MLNTGMIMKQQTLTKCYTFEGKGLHTGRYAHMTIMPSRENTGIIFHRTDIGEGAFVAAVAENVSNTARSTTISRDGVSVVTIEHIMSALTGLGVDNAIIEIDSEEVPILDGSALPYIKAITPDGLKEQDCDRTFITLNETVDIKDEKTGSYVRIEPADELSYDVTVDFNSRVLGVQDVHWDLGADYCSEVAPCRTFVFFHELEFLASKGLVKGGDVENAIVIVEHPVTEEQLVRMTDLFQQPKLSITPEGYLSNLTLRFQDECGRHKLLDLIGDLRLAGGYLKASIKAYKPGHGINTITAKALREAINKK